MNFLGILVAVGCILAGMMMEGSHPSALIDIPAFLIVIGAAFGAAMVQFPFKVIISTFGRLKWLITPPRIDYAGQTELLIALCNKARQDSMIALEGELDNIKDPFTRRATELLIEATDMEVLRETIETILELEEYENEQPAKVVEAVGGYAPCMGIIGAVLGLIHAMGLLDQPELLGPAIAVAFVATIYGVGLANIVLLPFGNRMKSINHDLNNFKVMTLEGLLVIGKGGNILTLKNTLSIYSGIPIE
ncbi:MAG: flagellar motor protein [Succinivibrionaceae bacterium]